jgi:hypothetical protein
MAQAGQKPICECEATHQPGPVPATTGRGRARVASNPPDVTIGADRACNGGAMSSDIVVRTATPADISALAALRWRWALPEQTPQPDALRDFSSALKQWMTPQREVSVCKIALLDAELADMAWLVRPRSQP